MLNFDRKGIIENDEYLDVERIPDSTDEILHRGNVFDFLIDHCGPILDRKKADNVIIYGPSGTGKTAVVHTFLNDLKSKVTENDIEITILCKMVSNKDTKASILKYLIKEFEYENNQSHTKISNSTSEYEYHFQKLCLNHDGYIILVLDELDNLSDPEVINFLTRLSLKNISFIGISNDIDFLNIGGGNSKSSATNIFYKNVEVYDAVQLEGILRDRAQKALSPENYDKIGSYTFALISARVKSEKFGDARVGINNLKKIIKK